MAYYDEDGNEVGKFPAIVCAIRDVEGNLVTLHRTYLTQNGKKAKVGNAKKMMPIPDGLDVNGAAIRLGEPTEGILRCRRAGNSPVSLSSHSNPGLVNGQCDPDGVLRGSRRCSHRTDLG